MRDSLAQTCHRCDALQVLSIRIAVYLEISLEHLQLLLGECGTNAFRLALVVTVYVATICRNANKLEKKIGYSALVAKCENLVVEHKVANLEPTITGRCSSIDRFQIMCFA